jgi:superfamily II DNA or RNA helicase
MLSGLTMPKNRPHVKLRDYQQAYVDGVIEEWKQGRTKTLCCAPTGSGKTTLMGAIIAKEVENGGRVLVATDRKKLTRQFAHRTEVDFGIPCGVEMAGEEHGGEDVVCCTVQTITNRIAKGKFHPEQFTLLAFDEAHLSMAAGFQSVAQHFSKAKIVGLTATPRRGDKKDLLSFYDTLVEKVTLSQLIDQGHLAPLTVKNIPIHIRLERQGKGDFDDAEIGHAIEPYLDSCADALIEGAKDRCSLVFLPLIATSERFTAMLNDKGLRAEHVDGTMGEDEVNKAIRRLELGQISCLCCSMILSTGVDIRPLNCILNLRPTRSWTLFVQQVGRGTRTFAPARDGPPGTKWPLKTDCILMDPLWLTSDHNLLQRPAVLVSENQEEVEAVERALKNGGGGDLMAAKKSAREEREEILRKRLEAMKHKAARTIDAVELFTNSGHMELVGYEEMARWEKEKPSDKQIEFLTRQKVNIGPEMTKGMASKMIDIFMERINKGLASGGQIKFMQGLGMSEDEAWKMSFEGAKDWLNKNAPPKPSWQRKY